jgi:SAM-dependent methyltransferase
MRRRAEYTGIDSSDYVIERFGRSRHIIKGSFGGLRNVRGAFDLVICSDVLHYVNDDELRRGLPHLERLTDGVAFIEVLTAEDQIIGDIEGLIRRPAASYRRQFTKAGFAQAGPYCWIPRVTQQDASELESVRP